MKKMILLIVAAILLISPFAAAISTRMSTTVVQPMKNAHPANSNFTHAVFIEQGTATWCPNCPNAAEALFSIYNSSDYPFYYVALVYDQTKLAKDRMYGHYRGFAFPTIFIDGGFSQKVGGASTPQLLEQLYRPVIEEAGARVVHPLVVTTNVTGHGNAKLDITVTVKNIGTKPYIGILRSYVTEIVSRWHTQTGHPYHFALLDYAIKKIIFLSPQKTQTYTATFDGAAKHGNLTFPDIVDNNIMVISTVTHWQPHMIAKEQYVGAHLAFYIDQVTGAKVN
jgi:glutaredoxin